MIQFTPEISIVAVDEHDAIVSFDSAAANDHARTVRALRIGRDFAAVTFELNGFADTDLSAVGDRKEYRGTIDLVTTARDGTVQRHALAAPELWLPAQGKMRRGGGFVFPAPADVALALRQGLADAMGQALAAYYGKEAQIDLQARTPAAPAVHELRGVGGAAAPTAAQAAWFGKRPAANQAGPASTKQRTWRRIMVAALVTPLVVYGALAATGATRRADPIQEAVAHAMAQDPRSLQAQVDLTKETLKQMGLDPGKAGDTGCFAQQ